MTLSNSEIQNALLYEGDHELLQKIEKQLQERLARMDDGMTKADLMGLLVIAMLKKNIVETNQTKKIFKEYIALIKEVDSDFRCAPKKSATEARSSSVLYKIFLTLTIQRCIYIESLLAKMRSMDSLDIVRITRYSLEIRLAQEEKNTVRQVALVFYKYSTLFGTSFLVLLSFILLVVLFFASIFYAYDFFHAAHPAISTIGKLDSFDYYFYVSMATFSNLGVDTSLAANLLLRMIFSVEQIL